jgi:signal transduction histidine kinase/GGDEF domain-containing protein
MKPAITFGIARTAHFGPGRSTCGRSSSDDSGTVTAPFLATLRSVSGVIDAIGLPVVILDSAGTAVETNRAWRVHARHADGFEGRVSEGASYLRACERAAADGSPEAAALAAGLRELLAGERELLEVEYPSRASTEERWVRLRAVAASDGTGMGAVLVHQDITARKRLEEVVGSIEHHDASTGLLDEGAIAEHVAERLAEARRTGGRVAVTTIGVAGLARVAAEIGAPACDELLVQLTGRVRRAVRGDDALCRSGPDRFTLISKGLGPNGFEALTDRLTGTLCEPYRVTDRSIEIDVVVAGAISDPGSSAAAVIAQANARFESAWAAMPADRHDYRPDPGEGGVLVAFPGARHGDDDVASAPERAEPAATVALPDSAEREAARHDAALQAALAADAVSVAYRPVVRFHDRRVAGAAAEPVVADGSGGALTAAEARAAAERIGRRSALEWALLRSALVDAACWQQRMPEATLPVLVPVGAELFADEGLAARVADAVEALGLAPSRLTLVVEADAVAAAPEQAARQLARLTMGGTKLCIDDFGRTSFSLLELSRMPIDTVRVRLQALTGTAHGGEVAVVAAVLAVADALGLRVVAAEVDGEDQAREVRRLGCSYGEGEAWPAVGPDALLEAAASGLGLPAAPAASAPGSEPAPAGRSAGGQAQGAAAEEMDLVFRAIVHEVRTPLTVAMGYASLLELSTDPQSAKAARSIRRAAERINRQLGSLEDVRMMDQGALQLDRRDLDLRGLVRDVCAELCEVMGLDVVVREPAEGQPQVVAVVVDELRIGQVVINLVTNAAKYCSKGTPVEVRLWVEDGWVEVAVVDDGPGVPVEQVGRIFRKYARADGARPGSGLGLYLARGIARAHGGDVTYRRRNLRPGSAFTLRLPLAGTEA